MRAWKNYYFCFNGGWTIQDILFQIIAAMKFQNCYFTIIKNLEDWTHWDDYAKTNADGTPGWPEDCSSSNDADITVWSWNPITTDTTTYFFGAASYTPTCVGGQIAAEEPLHRNLYDLAFNYYTDVNAPG